MKNTYFRVILIAAIWANALLSNAQLTTGISVNTNGTQNEVGAILDLSNHATSASVPTTGPYGFLPPYVALSSATVLGAPNITGGTAANLSGLLVYNTNTNVVNGLSGAGLYYWNNALTIPAWIYLGSGGALLTADNGLNLNGLSVQMGTGGAASKLLANTNISSGANPYYELAIWGSGATGHVTDVFSGTGQVGIGDSVPNAMAALDLTNTPTGSATDWGLMLPTVTTATLPTEAGVNGMLVFNSDLQCPLVEYSGAWYYLDGVAVAGGGHGSQTFAAQQSRPETMGTQYFIVPECITQITIIARGAFGGTGSGNAKGGEPDSVTATAVPVSPGEVLGIVAGRQSVNTYCNLGGGGGGGGSFVWRATNTTTPLVAAGGGGGGGYDHALQTTAAGANASLTTTPTASGGSGAAGNGATGTGGTRGGLHNSGGGGAGWNTSSSTQATGGQVLESTGAGGLGKQGAGAHTLPFQGGQSASYTNSAAWAACSKYCGYCGPSYGGYGGGGGGGSDSIWADYNTNGYLAGPGGGGGGWAGGGGGTYTSSTVAYGGGGGSCCVNGAAVGTFWGSTAVLSPARSGTASVPCDCWVITADPGCVNPCPGGWCWGGSCWTYTINGCMCSEIVNNYDGVVEIKW